MLRFPSFGQWNSTSFLEIRCFHCCVKTLMETVMEERNEFINDGISIRVFCLILHFVLYTSLECVFFLKWQFNLIVLILYFLLILIELHLNFYILMFKKITYNESICLSTFHQLWSFIVIKLNKWQSFFFHD